MATAEGGWGGFLHGCSNADLGMEPAMFDEVAQHHVPQILYATAVVWCETT